MKKLSDQTISSVSSLLLQLLLLVILVLNSSCTRTKAPGETPVKIGALLVLTGQYAMQGAAFKEGIELAAEEINAKGGIDGRPIRMIIEDTRGTPKDAHTAARKLVSVNRVVAGLTMSYPDTKVGGMEFQRAGIPSIALWDSSPEIDDMGQFIFSLGPWAPSTGENSADFAYDHLQARSAAIIYSVEEWSEYVSEYFAKQFEKRGGTIVYKAASKPEDSDFRSILARTKQATPDVIFAPITHTIVPFFTQLKHSGLEAHTITGAIVTEEHIRQAPAMFEKVYRSEIRDPDNARMKEPLKAYEAKYHKEATLPWYIATGYDAVHLLAKVIAEAGPSPEKIKDGLYAVQDFPGASKTISIQPGGSSPTYERMFQIRNGHFEFAETP